MRTLLSLVVLLTFAACSTEPKAFSKLEGDWQILQQPTYEKWENSDGQWLGTSYGIKETGDTIITEKLQLVKRDGQWFYQADLVTQERVAYFELDSSSSDVLVFRNDSNEFPQLIRYAWPNDTNLIIWLYNRGGRKFELQLRKDD